MTQIKLRTVLALFVIAILALVLVYMTPPIIIHPQNLLPISPKHSVVPHGKSKTTSTNSNVHSGATGTPVNP